MSANKPSQLTPARPHATDDARAYMPRIPWRVVVIGTLSIATVVGGYWLKERHKANELRASILHVHQEELAQAKDAYTALRDKIETLVLSASQSEPATLVDPRLNLSGLRSGVGLYLRMPLTAAKTKAGIAAGAKAMQPDLITTCLGLLPTSARGLYEKGEFLTPEFVEQTKKLSDVMSLRVQDEVLSRHIRADLPSVLGLLRSDWLLLVLEEGPNRSDWPVQVFLWDLRHGDALLRARVQSQGALLTTRILSKGAPASPKPAADAHGSGAASDCSIAAQLKALTGHRALTLPEARTPAAAAP